VTERLWLYCLPLLVLPTLGQGRATAFGTLELSDYLIAPYLFCLFAASAPLYRRKVDGLTPSILALLAWAGLSTITIPLRYSYPSNDPLIFSLLKLAKFMLYGCAGLMTARRLNGPEARRRFHWALLAVACLAGGLYVLVRPLRSASHYDPASGFKSNNAVSVGLAILICYLAALCSARYGTRLWRRAALPALLLAAAGAFVSGGRGGWLAAGAGLFYIVVRHNRARTALSVAALSAVTVVVFYSLFPEFRQDVDRTLRPDPAFVARYGAGPGGIDDGGRMRIWLYYAPRVLKAPLFGSGFFHRGDVAGHAFTGSHNFFLQMFLETGIPGGLMMIGLFAVVWKQAGSRRARAAGLSVPVRAALVAAVVGAMGGEYFYGGVTLLFLLFAYAPLGSLPQESGALRRPRPSLVRSELR